MKSTSFVFISVSLPGLEFMLVNEFLVKKPDKFEFTFIENAPFYLIINSNVKKFAISVLLDTRSITGPGALLQ